MGKGSKVCGGEGFKVESSSGSERFCVVVVRAMFDPHTMVRRSVVHICDIIYCRFAGTHRVAKALVHGYIWRGCDSLNALSS